METEVREVEFDQAVAEEKEHEQATRPSPCAPAQPQQAHQPIPDADIDQLRDQPQDEQQEAEAQMEQAKEDQKVLYSNVASKQWMIGPENNRMTYFQEELSVIAEIQWFSLLGEFLDKAMSGEGAISLSTILSPPQRSGPGQFQLQDFQDADTFVHALGKLLVFMPEFMEKSICIWLAVPDYEWPLVREYMKMSPQRGGMPHEMFEEILHVFISQNYDAIDRFFRERFGRLRDHYLALAQEASQRRSSKR